MTSTTGVDIDFRDRLSLTFTEDYDLQWEEVPDRIRIADLVELLQTVSTMCARAHWIVLYARGSGLASLAVETQEALRGTAREDPVMSGLIDSAWLAAEAVQHGLLMWDNDSDVPQWASPRLDRISKQSPLLIDLVIDAVPLIASSAVIGVVVQALRNPYHIGAWLPTVAAGWRETRNRVLEAEIERLRLQVEQRSSYSAHIGLQEEMTRDVLLEENAWRKSQDSGSPSSSPIVPDERFQQFDDAMAEQLKGVQVDATKLRNFGLHTVEGEDIPRGYDPLEDDWQWPGDLPDTGIPRS